MNYLILGGSGFIGHYLSRFFLDAGHRVTSVGRSKERIKLTHERFGFVKADTTQCGKWGKLIPESDIVINLTGQTIFHRWNDEYKQAIYDSRILTTRNIVTAMSKGAPKVFLTTSAVGIYGSQGDTVLTENHPAADDFLARVCVDWEHEANQAREKDIRVVITRFGLVLGKGGGALKQMLPMFKFGVGGPMGNGLHWQPWVHIRDLAGALQFLIGSDTLSGPFNICAPNPVQQKDFARILGKVLNRPAFMPAPAFMLKLVMGELGDVLFSSQRAAPEKLLKSDFQFTFPELESALRDLTL